MRAPHGWRETYEVITGIGNDIGTLDDLRNESKDVEDGNDSSFGALVTSHVCG